MLTAPPLVDSCPLPKSTQWVDKDDSGYPLADSQSRPRSKSYLLGFALLVSALVISVATWHAFHNGFGFLGFGNEFFGARVDGNGPVQVEPTKFQDAYRVATEVTINPQPAVFTQLRTELRMLKPKLDSYHEEQVFRLLEFVEEMAGASYILKRCQQENLQIISSAEKLKTTLARIESNQNVVSNTVRQMLDEEGSDLRSLVEYSLEAEQVIADGYIVVAGGAIGQKMDETLATALVNAGVEVVSTKHLRCVHKSNCELLRIAATKSVDLVGNLLHNPEEVFNQGIENLTTQALFEQSKSR